MMNAIQFARFSRLLEIGKGLIVGREQAQSVGADYINHILRSCKRDDNVEAVLNVEVRQNSFSAQHDLHVRDICIRVETACRNNVFNTYWISIREDDTIDIDVS